jgi:hypothetical protein
MTSLFHKRGRWLAAGLLALLPLPVLAGTLNVSFLRKIIDDGC